MRTRIILLWTFVATAACLGLSASGCGAQEAAVEDDEAELRRSGAVVDVGSADNGKTIVAKPGQTVFLKLQDVGSGWQVSANGGLRNATETTQYGLHTFRWAKVAAGTFSPTLEAKEGTGNAAKVHKFSFTLKTSTGVATCSNEECGTRPLFNQLCSDGTEKTATACTRDTSGTCVWQVNECPAPGAHTWFASCGFPVCQNPTPAPVAGCATAGTACSTLGETCGAGGESTCGVKMVCADSDPRLGPGGCPISSRSFKDDVRYLSDGDRQRMKKELLTTKLATYSYKPGLSQPDGKRLGFILEDKPADSPAVDMRVKGVDLYGYVSMAVATIQLQEAEIKALREEVSALKRGEARK